SWAKNAMLASRPGALKAAAIALSVSTETAACSVMGVPPVRTVIELKRFDSRRRSCQQVEAEDEEGDGSRERAHGVEVSPAREERRRLWLLRIEAWSEQTLIRGKDDDERKGDHGAEKQPADQHRSVAALEPRHERAQATPGGEAPRHDGAGPVARPELGEGQGDAAFEPGGVLDKRHVDRRAREESSGEEGDELGGRHVIAARSARWTAVAGPRPSAPSRRPRRAGPPGEARRAGRGPRPGPR